MAMPNRKDEVKAIVARYPQTFQGPSKTVDERRRLLIPIICRELNKIDNGQWALIHRMDRQDSDPKPGRLTSDVVAWRPTKEHVDVLSGSGAMWNEHPPFDDRDWLLESPDEWPSWDEAVNPVPPPPVPSPPPVPPPPAPGSDLQKQVDHLSYVVTQALSEIVTLTQRVNTLVDTPLPELYVEGNTSRDGWHAHTIKLPVLIKR